MQWVEGIAAGTTLLSVGCFLLYLVALLGMPTGRRPRITPIDRLGRPMAADENPGYRDTEDEHHT